MRYLHNKRRYRSGEGEKHSFAFFAVGAIVVLTAVFMIGLQVGRVIEKRGTGPEGRNGKASLDANGGKDGQAPSASADARKEMGAFSEGSWKTPAVQQSDAMETTGKVENKLTFQETLTRKEAEPVALVAPSNKDSTPGPKKTGVPKKFIVQAGTFRDKGKAESLRKRLAEAGYAVRMVKGTGNKRQSFFRVLVGPFGDGVSANKAVESLKKEMQVDAYLLSG